MCLITVLFFPVSSLSPSLPTGASFKVRHQVPFHLCLGMVIVINGEILESSRGNLAEPYAELMAGTHFQIGGLL